MDNGYTGKSCSIGHRHHKSHAELSKFDRPYSRFYYQQSNHRPIKRHRCWWLSLVSQLHPRRRRRGRAVAGGGALLLLVFALSSTFLYLTSSSAPAASPSVLLNLKPFAARCPPAATAPPLRVFMYDLPPRFHVAVMMDSSASVPASGLPAWPPSSGGIRRQHSVEYWMMASLLDGGAEAFFVPFFSSLSFNVHGRNMTDPETEADRLLQVELMDILWKSKYWQQSAGCDHVIPMHHPNAFRFLRDMVNASILIVADFGNKGIGFLEERCCGTVCACCRFLP